MIAFHWLSRLYPWSVSASDELRRSLEFLGAELSAETVVRAGYGGALVAAFLAPFALLLVPRRVRVPAAVALVACSLGVAHAIHRVPVALAAARRTSSLGDAPAIVGRAVLRMRIEPTAETAATFAGRTSTGPLAASLREHVRRARGTPRTGLDAFAAEWEPWQPSLRRSLSLVETAAGAPPGERERTLDRALAAVLDGTRNRMAAFANDIRGPATGLYAFGVLLPLALVAVFPAARLAGVPVSIPVLIAVYDVLLPAVLLATSAWLLARRPVAFRPPRVRRSHPAVPDRRWPVLAASIAVGVGGWVVTAALLPSWTRWLALLGGVSGTLLTGWFRPITRVRDHVRAVEGNLTDALYLVGRRIQEGESVEAAIGRIADHVEGETGVVFADAARIQRQLRAGVEESFLGEHGALADVPSQRARSTASLLALAAREGRPAGRAVVAMADHVDELVDVEREARHELAHVTGTLRSTATVFGPLVAGATVALSDGMTGTDGLGADSTALATSDLGLVVGVYVFVLAAILAALAVGLERGLDRALVGQQVGLAVSSAVAVYLVSFVAAGMAV